MDAERDEKVRERAYAIWEREGRPEGGAERHWAEAEEELRAEERGRAEVPAASTAGTETWTDPGGSVGGEADPAVTSTAPEGAPETEAGIGPDTGTTGGMLP
jgi:Protein of unknown function (DUF2934)